MLHDSASFFKAAATGLLTFTTIRYVLSKMISKDDPRRHWNRVNIATSLIHCMMSTVLCIYCVIENPKMCTTDMISSFTPRAYAFVSFEIAYFLFDFIDMIRNSAGVKTFGVLLHHVIIMICFGIAVYFGRYIGYAVLSLFIEVNSIFLHARQLFIMSKRSKQGLIYRLNTILNILTFFVFRFALVAYMSYWLYLNRSLVPTVLCLVGQSGLLIMTIINMNLLYRLIRSDFFKS